MRRCFGHLVRVTHGLPLVAATTSAVLAATGCSSGGGSTAPQTGSLTVTITAPAGVTPAVTVNGPAGFTKALSATTTLSALAVGSYTVTATTVTVAGSIVAVVDTAVVAGSPAAVTANATATAAARYATRPGTGGLWVANLGVKAVLDYTAAQLATTTSLPPAIAVGTSAFFGDGVAFDANGNLWETFHGSDEVVEYAASQLGASGIPAPPVVINGSSLAFPGGLAFDASGNLWIVNDGGPSVIEFTASQLATSGHPTAAVVIGASGGSLDIPSGIAFDGSGNLWVSNAENSTIVEFTPAQLVSSGTPTPAVTLSASGGSLSFPEMIAFDASGNLWVSNEDDSSVVAFSPSQLTTSGSPTPAVTLNATGGSLSFPGAVAFDASGNLWVVNLTGSIVEFTASQLLASGSPTPQVTISGSSLNQPFGIAFDPHAANLPLKP